MIVHYYLFLSVTRGKSVSHIGFVGSFGVEHLIDDFQLPEMTRF